MHIFIPYCSLLKQTLCLRTEELVLYNICIYSLLQLQSRNNLLAKFMSHSECTERNSKVQILITFLQNSRCHPIRKQNSVVFFDEALSWKFHSKFTLHTNIHSHLKCDKKVAGIQQSNAIQCLYRLNGSVWHAPTILIAMAFVSLARHDMTCHYNYRQVAKYSFVTAEQAQHSTGGSDKSTHKKNTIVERRDGYEIDLTAVK